MKKIATLLLAIFLCHSISSFAVPAYPVKKNVKMQDGRTLTLTLTGDEHLHYYADPEGNAWREHVDGTFKQIPSSELLAMRQASLEAVKEADQRRLARSKRQAPLTGKKKGLVILVNFTDKYFATTNPLGTFSDMFNKTGYKDNGMYGSVRDYFYDQSYGKFELDFDVVGPFRLSHPMNYYGAPADGAHDANPHAMIEEAVRLADSAVDFTRYDWDGDGWVDQVFVVYAGHGENYGADPNTIWPHEHSIAYKELSFDGVSIGTYACSCELMGREGSKIDGIGTACHEFSHCLGIMDHYDTSGGDNFGMGNWDLMCSGSYNNNGCTPSAYTAYERWLAGWIEPTVISDKCYITGMKPIEDAPEAYILYNEGNHNEYYLLENRQIRGWDSAQNGHGLLVVHVDYDRRTWAGNAINADSDHQRMTIIPADNMLNTGSVGGDPFPGTGKKTSLTDTTIPAATLYNENIDGTFLMGKPLDDIQESTDGLISFAAMRGVIFAPELFEPELLSPTSFRASWTPVENATSYELTVTERMAPYATPEEAMLITEDFNKCYSKSNGISNIGTKLANYLSTSGWTGENLYTSPYYLKMGKGEKQGSITTPWLDMPNNGDATIVVCMTNPTATEEDRPSFVVKLSFGETTLTGRMYYHSGVPYIVHASDLEDDFKVTIVSDQTAYMSRLSVYDGDFSYAQLGLTGDDEESDEEESANVMAKVMRKLKSYEYTSPDAHYDFLDINPTSIYYYRVRAVTPLGYSKWSQQMTMDMKTATPILSPTLSSESLPWYDLQGRPVAAPTHGLYIHGGRKVLVK